jgi:hypothetical protein
LPINQPFTTKLGIPTNPTDFVDCSYLTALQISSSTTTTTTTDVTTNATLHNEKINFKTQKMYYCTQTQTV